MRPLAFCAVVGALVTLPACYRQVPLETATPPVGETLVFEITDRGRVGLGDRLGPRVDEIEGRLVRAEGEELVINVFRVAAVDGTRSRWSGEQVRLDRDYVGRVSARELSKTRTWLLAAGVTTAVVALIATQSLTGLFNDDDPDPDPSPPSSILKLRLNF